MNNNFYSTPEMKKTCKEHFEILKTNYAYVSWETTINNIHEISDESDINKTQLLLECYAKNIFCYNEDFINYFNSFGKGMILIEKSDFLDIDYLENEMDILFNKSIFFDYTALVMWAYYLFTHRMKIKLYKKLNKMNIKTNENEFVPITLMIENLRRRTKNITIYEARNEDKFYFVLQKFYDLYFPLFSLKDKKKTLSELLKSYFSDRYLLNHVYFAKFIELVKESSEITGSNFNLNNLYRELKPIFYHVFKDSKNELLSESNFYKEIEWNKGLYDDNYEKYYLSRMKQIFYPVALTSGFNSDFQ